MKIRVTEPVKYSQGVVAVFDYDLDIAGANAARELMQEKLDVAVEALEWYNSVYKKSVFVKEIGTAFSENALSKIRGGE